MQILLILVAILILADGLALTVMPEGVKRLVSEANPRMLQAVGLVDTAVGLALVYYMVMLSQ
jgi:uncharacterized protein YjeT (DUF2065 family)